MVSMNCQTVIGDETYTETTNVAVISEVELKSCITRGTPGAKNDDPSGVKRVSAERTPMFNLARCQHRMRLSREEQDTISSLRSNSVGFQDLHRRPNQQC